MSLFKRYSDAYPESVLRLVWSVKEGVLPIDRNPEITMPDMQLKDIRTGYCNGTYATGKLLLRKCSSFFFIGGTVRLEFQWKRCT